MNKATCRTYEEGCVGFSPSLGRIPSRRALRASLRLSLSFQTNLSLAEAEPATDLIRGCRSEHRRSQWPEGRGAGCAESPVGSSTHLSPPDTQNAPDGMRFDQHRVRSRRGIVNPIHGVHPSALRAPGPAFGCPILFQTKLSNPGGFVHHLSPPDTQNAPRGGPLRPVSRWRVVRDCEPHPWGSPLRAARSGADLRSSLSFQTNLSNRRVRPPPLSARYAKRPARGRFAYLAEREGFEPSIRLLTRYSLSRGAPSATRASLRTARHRCAAGKDTDSPARQQTQRSMLGLASATSVSACPASSPRWIRW